ncbi:DUF4259 domain-containing protein [Yinghuangia sp. YIM S10712]|uniref:DUF4259 domain-containing protein n=1 Tax=Yinghuangia sp. YIM S10712 TaxID=3436930 RepID=UPI003F538E4D
MGTWDIGPFDNDMAADFADALDEAPVPAREGIIRNALAVTIGTRGYLDAFEGAEAVAAAAVIAAQCPGGEPVGSVFGPQSPVPILALNMRPLAIEALDRVLAEDSELAALWDEAGGGPQWRQVIAHIRMILDACCHP